MHSALLAAALVTPLALLAPLAWRVFGGGEPGNFGVVEEGRIYRSARLTPRTLRDAHARLGLRTILDLGAHKHGSAEERAIDAAAREMGVRRYRFHLKGNGTGNPNFFVQALRLMQDDRALPLLIHCHAGAQRTGACVIFYRTLVQGRTMREAFEEAMRHRVRPNRDWKMLAYVADFAPRIKAALETGEAIEGFDAIPYPIDDPEGLVAASRAHLPAARAYPAPSS